MTLKDFMETETYKIASEIVYINTEGIEIDTNEDQLLDATVINHNYTANVEYLEIELEKKKKYSIGFNDYDETELEIDDLQENPLCNLLQAFVNFIHDGNTIININYVEEIS